VALGGGGIPNVRVAAVSPAPGGLDVFAAGAGNHLWHWKKAGSGSWSVEDLGGNLPAEGVSAVSWGLNRIDVFAASGNPGNPVQHWYSNGGAFGSDLLQGASFAVGAVSAVSRAENRLDVFGISSDQRLIHWEWDGSQWSGPYYRGEGIPAGDVSAVARTPHRLDIFVAGAGNTLRQWPGGGLENATTQPWTNLATNRQENPIVGHLRPDSVDELVNIVREAEQLGRGVRAVGSGWSNSDVAVSPAYVVETDKLDNVLTDVLSTSLNARGAALRPHLVHVEAGIKLHVLNTLLDNMGLALNNVGLALKTMGGSSGQSLAGVVSTSAHGMDFDRGPIPDMVRAIHLVGPGGVQHWIEPGEGEAITTLEGVKSALGLPDANIHYDDDWFNSVLVSAGSMGIIYSLIVEVVGQYDLISNCEVLDWNTAKTRLRAVGGPDDPFAGMRGLQVVIQPYPRGDGTRLCYFTRRIEARPPTLPAPGGPIPSWLLPGITLGTVRTLAVDRAEIDNTVWDLTNLVVGCDQKRGIGHTIMGGPDPGPARGLAVEVVFDATNTRYLDFIDAALEILRKAFYEEPGSLGFLGWVSLRFQGRSRALLSPQRFSRSCTVEFAAAWRIPAPDMPAGFQEWPDTPILMRRLEAEGRKFGGIQHWGMNDDLNASDVRRAYPRLNTWRRVRRALTDGGRITTFDNDFTERCGLSKPPQLPEIADYDNDGKTDFSVWRPSTGTWWVIESSSGANRTQQWGTKGDIPVPGDYDCDGKTDFAVWRPADGVWWVIDSSTAAPRTQQWGAAGDVPVPGDYDGDDKTDFAVWRPGDGTWWVIDSSTGATRNQQWGEPDDVPVPGDYDGDGRTDFAVWRPYDGVWWVIDSSTAAPRTQQWGQAGDIPVPGDYDGDGKTDFAVWRPGDGIWWVIDSSTGTPRSQQWGQAGDIPVPGDYDGDGKTDFAVWRPADGVWWVIDSSTGGHTGQQWGQAGDIPVNGTRERVPVSISLLAPVLGVGPAPGG
jgi:hypothetical protein